MGIFHSTTRLLGSKPQDEERPIHPYGDSSRSSPKVFIFGSLIFKSLKGILQSLCSVFYFLRPRKTADPVLPIQNPASSISTEPLLLQTTPISSPTNDSSADSTPDTAYVDIPEYRCLVAYLTVSHEIDPPNDVPLVEKRDEREEEEEEKAKIRESIEEERAKMKNVVVVNLGRWVKHYSSNHRILLVGDGDFSFSASLALAFEWASNMIATSLNSKAFLKKNYSNALSNIEELRSRECKVMLGIDATKMAKHALLGCLKFDRIVFNFPFAGFFKNLPRDSQLRRHKRLVSLFFKNARVMISENGEIHISHKTNEFHRDWNLESIASSHKLGLIEAVGFNHLDYPGYNTKCGFGGDNNFNCHPSKTFKFGHKRVRS